ncbi:MAG: mechanosensitive ion channel [Gemmataceae bacterium]|nr:mechanosensitive ion channel [Gemmataceae bacterium]
MFVPLRSPVSSAGRRAWLARAALLTAVVGFFSPGDARPDAPREADKSRLPEAKKVELHRLTNEELLKQVDARYSAASLDYLAQFRALATAEALFEEVRGQTDAVKDAPPPGADRPPGEDAAKKAVDAARARQDVVRRRLKLVQGQKALLDRITTGLEACRSAAVAFQNALDDLKGYALEGSLRVKDGSLTEDRLPERLRADFLKKKKAELADEVAGLTAKSADVQRRQEAVGQLWDGANKAALAADADVVEESRRLGREQQRQKLEKGIAGKNPDDLVAELERLVEEGAGLKGTYELALSKFTARAKAAARLQAEVEALKQPDAKIPQLTRAEDVETAAKAIQELIAFYAARKEKLEGLRAALAELAREGGEFEADAAVSEEHLFKMQVLAELLKKMGVPDGRLPAKGRAAKLGAAAARQKKDAAAVRAATEKARAELALLDRQLPEAATAGDAAAKQLASLKESRDVTLAALEWEGRLKGMTGPQIVETFAAARKGLADRLNKLKGEAEVYARADAAAAEARARLDALNDPFLRAAEEQGQAEKQKILGELRKEAGLERVAGAPAPTPPPAGDPRKPEPEKKPAPPDTRTELEKATERLTGFQQLLAGRVRVLDEREAKQKELLAALAALEQSAAAYSKALADARLLALRSSAAAVELKQRLGRGDLAADAVPEGVTDALRLATRTKLDAAATAVLNAVQQLRQTRDQLLRKDPDADALAAATKDLLTAVGKRLDLLADLRRLAADYRREKPNRPPSEVKRLEQRAAERQDDDSSVWDTLLGIDTSTSGKTLAELLETYYRELTESEEKQENLARQREKVEKLVELTRQETTALARVRPLLDRQLARLEAAREEEVVLARARLRPDRAEELLKTYQTRTGRLLPRPAPVADKDKGEKVEEFARLLFERHVTVEAARKWDEVLGTRTGPTGVKAEAGVYQDELTSLNATSAANVRRVRALTGGDGQGAVTGGEIGRTRDELTRVRTRGVWQIVLKIAIIVVVALVLPRLLMAVIGRARGDSSNLVRSALRTVLITTVWLVALTLILTTLGVDVTAILAGLGIGGLAIGLAAQHMISDLLGALVIFAERRFRTGDVIRLDGDDPTRVLGLTWRSTQVLNDDGLVVTIPNRKVTEATIENLTRAGQTYDSLSVSVTTPQDIGQVLAAIRGALEEGGHLATDHEVSVLKFRQRGEVKRVKYRFSWFLPDYEARDRTRDEVFARIAARLDDKDLAGTEITLT